jgi:transcriptional regulator with XRE-family HTH domain
MARAALGWSGADLAKAAGISARTVAKFELGQVVSADTVEAFRKALVQAGIEFHQAERRAGVSYSLRD